MGKIITIVIPTYNMEKYLHKCLDSLIVDNKLMDILEVLIIDDGSKDSSLEIAKNYQQHYPQTFKVIKKENGNYGSCVNRGISEAKGKFIKILDADDSFFTSSFEVFVNLLTERDEDLILTDFDIVNSDGIVVKHDICRRITPFTTTSIKNFSEHLQMHNITYKVENLRKIGYKQTEGISYTDREWAFWPMTAVKTMYYIPICLYAYLVGREGQTMDERVYLKSADQEVQITKNMVSLWSKHKHDLGDAETYINCTLCNRLRFLIWGDLNNHHGINQTKFIEMDHFLKINYPDFYTYSNQNTILAKRFPYHFLRVWRNGYKLSVYNPYVILFRVFSKFFL